MTKYYFVAYSCGNVIGNALLEVTKYEVRIEYGKRGTMFGLYDSIGLTLLDGLTETRCKEIFQKLKEILEHEKAV